MLSPSLLARLFDGCIAARLRGDRTELFDLGGAAHGHALRWCAIDVDAFDGWLAHFWLAEGPPEPLAYPDAVSFLGTGPLARGPRWYSVDDTILGYVPHSPGAYRIPAASALPGLPDLAGFSTGVTADMTW